MIWNNIAFPVKEEWRDIQDFEGKYQISNYGRVKSLKRDIPWTDCNGRKGIKRVRERVLKPKIDKDGYESVLLSSVELGRKDMRSHRLVALHFLEEPLQSTTDLVVDHIDNSKDNNMWFNLQWVSSGENTLKYYSEVYDKPKTLSSLSKYDWLYIGYLYNSGMTYKSICENIGITVERHDTIWKGLSGERLSNVTGFKKGDFKMRKHPITKLSLEEVIQIIKGRVLDKKSLKTLSEEWGVAASMISRFCKGGRQPKALELFKERYKK